MRLNTRRISHRKQPKIRLRRRVTVGVPLLLLGLVVCLLGAPVRAQTAAGGATLSFPMQYVEKGGNLLTSIDPGKQEVKFRKEPDFGKDKVVRGALTVGPGPNDFIGFAVNLTKRVLYLDLNQNLDLTDDPQGVFKAMNTSGDLVYFREVALKLSKDGIERSYVLDPFYFYNGGSSSYIGVRSCYRADFELQGQKYRLDVQDNLDGELNRRDQFLMAPVTGNAEADKSVNVFNEMPVPEKLYLGGRQYRLRFTFGQGTGTAPLTASFTELTVPLGELDLDGQFIQRLVLDGDAGLAILDAPGRITSLPADKYRVQGIYLQSGSGKTALTSAAPDVPQFSVVAGAPSRLKAGGPLESSVTVSASGKMLDLNYILKGVGGEKYSVVNPDRNNPPKYSIYRGDRLLGTGGFEFG